MAIKKKYLQKQDLTSIETFTIDNRTESIYFNVIDLEETIPAGKTTFQILGSKYLTPEVELKIELIDRNGNPIYIEPIKYLGDTPSRHISVEVYRDTPSGLATLSILGSVERLADGTEIPDEWKGLYNVKWERNVFIDPTLKNTQPILFRGQAIEFRDGDKYPLPSIEVAEQVRGIIVPSGSGASETGFVTQSLFTGGNYLANASQFNEPQDINDASFETENGVQYPNPGIPYIPSPTTYTVQTDNVTDGVGAEVGLEDEVLNDDDFYEELHKAKPVINTPTPVEDDTFPPVKDEDEEVKPISIEPDFTGLGTLVEKSSGADFRSELAGGIFRAVPSVNYDLVKNVKGQGFTSSSFTASVVAVHSPNLIELDRPFTIANQKKFPGKNFKVAHNSDSFEIDFKPAGQTQNSGSGESTVIFRSFAEITVKNMRTFSGDVHRVKTLVKGYGDAASGFQLVADRIVEASDVLTDRLSPTLRNKIGVFESQTRVHRNWTLRQHSYGATLGAPYQVGDNDSGVQQTGSFRFGDTTTPSMMQGVHISGSNWQHSHALIFETNLSDLRMRPNVQYELRLRPILKVGKKQISTGSSRVNKARVRFFISGSNINQNLKGFEIPQVSTHPHAMGNMHLLGDPLRNNNGVIALESQDDIDENVLLDYGIVRIPFTPEFKNDVVVNNDTKLQIAVEAGELFLGRVEVIPATDTNFNPDEFTFVAPMPKLVTRPDFFDIAIQFFDRNSNKAKFVPIKQAVKFEGQNEVIQGTDNLLTGSLFIGNALLSGIEAGGINSAFIRSVGYVGFTSASSQGSGGFMMFSGSVLPDSPDSYQGVGLEIHDGNSGSFKFRTHNEDGVGEFDVRTNKFFFGKVGEQFVSGSDGNLEISSSGFHLQADGRVTASQLHIDGGVITGSLVIGESVTVDAATANSIRVPTGGPPFKAEILADGYARFTTGSIASINIDSNALFTTGSNSYYISGSATGIPTQGGRQNHFISASKFQVSALGDLTASNVLIDGGTITNNVTVQGTFSANEILVPAGADTQTASASISSTGAARFTSASIAGFRVSETSISSSDGSLILRDNGRITGSFVKFSGGTIGGFGLSDTTVSSSNSKLVMKSSGQITGSDVQFTGGDIGGWTIASSTLTGGNVQLSSVGTIKVGSVADATTTATTNAGFFADNSGNVLIKGNTNNNNYIKVAGGGGIDIKSTTFDLDATTLILDSGGDSGNGVIRLGGSGGPDSPTSNTAGIYMDGGGAFNAVGDGDNLVRFDAGALTIKAETFNLATSTMILDSGTNSGKIALGGTPNSNISGTNKGVYIDGTGDFLLFGNADNLIKFDASANSITMKSDTFDLATSTLVIDSGTNSGKIAIGSTPNTSVAGTNTGIYMDGTGDFLVRGDANNFLKINIGGSPVFDFKAQTFRLDTDNLDVNSALRRVTIDNGSNAIVYLGEIDGNGSGLPGSPVYGLKIFDGTGTADSDIIAELGTSENKIAGWTIGTDTISSNNLVLHSSGKIETSNFASGLRGWRIDSLQNGIAEFENARIRGTLSTTVFEKETINAVGGQLYVANSTMLTSSIAHPQGTVSASNATMSVVNVTGFTGSYEGGPGHTGTGKGEILAIKKVTDTGFSTEYVQVVSHSRLNPSSGTDLSGLLFVTRSYGGGIDETGTGLSSSLGDPAFLTAQQYEPGQVIVSTGRHIGGTGATTTGSGFVRINANPNDLSTPYIDIVERTGSAIYDVDLKARLGDLSGLASQYVRGATVKGFGLVTSNVFLTSSFFVGGVNEHISFQTGSFEAKLTKLNLSTNQGLTIQGEGSGSANKILLGLATNLSSGDGIFMDGGGDFRVGGASSNFVKFDASTGVLTVDGTINITGGATSEAITGLQGTLSASNAQSQSAMLGFASESNARADASGSIVSSSLGAKIDPYETQIVLSSGGMSLLKTEGQVLAEYNESINLRAPDVDSHSTASLDTEGFRIVEGGVTQSLFGQTTTIGVVTGSHLKASGSGLELLNGSTTRFGADSTGVSVGDPGNEHVRITTSGVELKDNTTTFGKFAATTTIGDTSTEHISISNTELRLKDGSTTRILMNSSGLTMGNHISINSSGNASFSGTVTIGGTDLDATNTLNANTTADNVGLGNVDNDSTATIQSGTTKANVGLGSVENLTAQNQAQTGLIAGTTITGGGITLNGGGVIKTINKDSVSDTTAGFFLGYDGSGAYDFAIGDANSFLKWDGSASSLEISGKITISNPEDQGFNQTFRQDNTPTAITVGDLWYDTNDGNKLYVATATGTGDWEATIDGTIATAQSAANSAQSTANTANSTANTANSTANTANSTANTANTAAANAQTAIDLMETRVVIDNTGMALKAKNDGSSLTLNGQTIAEYGTTTTLFDGVDDEDANKKLEINASGIKLFGSQYGNDYLFLEPGSIEMRSNNVRTLHITDNGINIGKSATGPSSANTPSAVIGNISLHGQGARIYGAAVDDYLDVKSDGVDVVTAGDTVAQFAATTIIGSSTDKVSISDSGITIRENNADRISLSGGNMSLLGGTIAINDGTRDRLIIDADDIKLIDEAGVQAFNVDSGVVLVGAPATEHIKITNSSLEVIDGATSTTYASFGSTTKIGDASNEHVEINSSTLDVKDGSTTLSSFGATTTIGQTSGRHISIDGNDVRVKQGSTVKSIFGASSITLGHNSTTDEHVIIDGSGLSVKDGSDTLAVFAATTTVGNTGNKHVRIDGTDGVQIKNSSTVLGTFGPNINVFNETTRGFTTVQSASVNLGRFATPTLNQVSTAGVETPNGIFDRVFGSTINASNLQATGSVSLFTSRSLASTTTSSVPFMVHDEVSSTDALIEPSFQFSTLYTAKGADAIGFPSVSSGSATGIFDISTTITSDGQNATPFKGQSGGGTSQAFNLLGLRVMNDTGDNTGGTVGNSRFAFKGALDSQPYTFINAVDKSRVPAAFRNLGGIRFQVKNSGAIVSLGNITAFGNTSNFTTLSDIKYKKDVTRISESLDRILELKPSKFVWKTTDTEDIGFIAQEVEEVIPEVVLTDKEGIMGAPDTKDYKTITYPKLIPLLVDSIQELTKKVSTLEDKIKELEK